MADVAETAIIDHGSHNVDIPVKGHLQKAGSEVTAVWWNKVLGKRSCNNRGRMSGEFPEEEEVGSGREAKGDRDGGLGKGSNSARAGGFGKKQKEGRWSDRTEEHQRVVGMGNGVQAHESQQHPGRACEEFHCRN